MDLQIFKGKTGVTAFKEYSNADTLRIMYAAGWYNNYKNSSLYQLNKIINENEETPSFEYYNKDVIADVKFNWLSSRSLHTKRIDIKYNPANISKQILTAVYEIRELLKAFTGSESIIIFISDKLARDVINNEESYNTLKIDEKRSAGESVAYLGTLAGFPTYINLVDDSSRICAINTKNLTDAKNYLTSYIKY